MIPNDLGKRIRAARAYAGLEIDVLADAMSLTPQLLGRIEAGVEALPDDDARSVIRGVAGITRLPEAIFTVDLATLRGEESPTSIAEALSAKIDAALERMDEVIAQAEQQMTRGAEQLDRFIAHQHEDRDLLRTIADHVGVDRGE